MKEGVKLPNREDGLPKRFYKDVTIAEMEGGWSVQLDGRPIKTPMKKTLLAPTSRLAQLMADEWAAQKERIDPFTMPVTRLAHGAIDSAMANCEAVISEVLKYAETDLLRHRGDAVDLRAEQAKVWDPFLQWAKAHLGAHLPEVEGLMPAETTPDALNALKAKAKNYDAWRLTALGQATAISTSAVLAFALIEGHASAEEVFTASRVDEEYQIARWGEDAEATKRVVRLKADFLAIGDLLAAL